MFHGLGAVPIEEQHPESIEYEPGWTNGQSIHCAGEKNYFNHPARSPVTVLSEQLQII